MNESSWREMGKAALDEAYDNFNAVADAQAHLDRWARLGAETRAAHPQSLDLAYGSRPRNRIDLFACGRADAPLFAFIHGGYWQRNAKESFAGMARGLDVAMIGYTLAPEASLTQIVAEIAAALAFLRQRIGTRRLVVSGWSAGGHLAATALALADTGLAISGIYDLAPIRATRLNEKLSLGGDEVQALSPILAPQSGPLVVAYGTAELPELRRQSTAFDAARRRARVETTLMPIPGANHFNVLDGLIDPSGDLTETVVRLARR